MRPSAHTHLVLSLTTRCSAAPLQLRFRDPRRFGGVWLLASPDLANANLGSQPLTLRPDQLSTILSHTRRPIKSALLDQSLIAGLGNIYADESLFAAGIHPLTATNQLSPEHIRRLTRAIELNGVFNCFRYPQLPCSGAWRATPEIWRSLSNGSPASRPAGSICSTCVGPRDSVARAVSTTRIGPMASYSSAASVGIRPPSPRGSSSRTPASRYPFNGEVEVDEGYLGGLEEGVHGRLPPTQPTHPPRPRAPPPQAVVPAGLN
ncbi:MAG: hypothetical protein NTU53_04145 [Planctomycetota bacterium]|nr:hypothetical protein [Planctomycetota bacterium]